jgi:hypothetical protein
MRARVPLTPLTETNKKKRSADHVIARDERGKGAVLEADESRRTANNIPLKLGPNRLHHTSCRQPCTLKALGLQRGIPYEISRDRPS